MIVETLEPTPERKASASAMIERMRAEYSDAEEGQAVLRHWLYANPEWISVFASLAVDVIDAKLSENH
jgi:hypothetical protein